MVSVTVMVFNATFNRKKFQLYRGGHVLLLEEIGVSWRKPPTCRKSLINFIT